MQKLHLTVAAIIEQRDRFLVVEETVQGKRVINQPAGHVEAAETLRDAVIRETREETAWTFSPAAISGVYLWQHPSSGERFLRVVFCGTCCQHNPDQTLDDGILRTLWLTRTELEQRQDMLRSPMVLRAIEDYQGKLRLPVNLFQQIDLDELMAQAAVI